MALDTKLYKDKTFIQKRKKKINFISYLKIILGKCCD